VASAIWPHGRWRFSFTGQGNHAGTTRMADRRDPMLTYAYTVLAANKEARLAGAHATIGRVTADPNATNAIAERVTAWLDARAAEQSTLDELVEAIRLRATERAGRDGTTVALTTESLSPVTTFDEPLRDHVATLLGGAPVLATGAGHDAGVLAAAGIPTTMLFVRNPTGISHAPAEHADDADCAAGVIALATVLEDLACR
jgi:N-carbamoyl-L-amino-acid hydrolase